MIQRMNKTRGQRSVKPELKRRMLKLVALYLLQYLVGKINVGHPCSPDLQTQLRTRLYECLFNLSVPSCVIYNAGLVMKP